MVTIQLKYLNNKSRKGLFFYIKETGIRGQYYKTDPTNMLQEKQIVDYYVNRHVKGKKKYSYARDIRPLKQIKKELIKKQLSKPSIQKTLGKGRAETLMKNANKANEKRIKKASTTLLKNMITNEETRKKLAEHQQQKKYKQYITHYVSFYDKDNKELLNAKFFNKTTYEVIKGLQKRKIEEDYFESEDSYSGGVVQKIKYLNARAINEKQSGKIHHWNVKIILRK